MRTTRSVYRWVSPPLYLMSSELSNVAATSRPFGLSSTVPKRCAGGACRQQLSGGGVPDLGRSHFQPQRAFEGLGPDERAEQIGPRVDRHRLVNRPPGDRQDAAPVAAVRDRPDSQRLRFLVRKGGPD